MKIASTTRPSPAGHLSHQRPSLLRWAPFEAAGCAARHSSPDHTYYSRSPAESTTTAPASRSHATLPPRAPQPPRARRRRTRPLPTLPAHSSTPPPNRTRPRPRSHRCPCGQLPPHPRRDHGSPRTASRSPRATRVKSRRTSVAVRPPAELLASLLRVLPEQPSVRIRRHAPSDSSATATSGCPGSAESRSSTSASRASHRRMNSAGGQVGRSRARRSSGEVPRVDGCIGACGVRDRAGGMGGRLSLCGYGLSVRRGTRRWCGR